MSWVVIYFTKREIILFISQILKSAQEISLEVKQGVVLLVLHPLVNLLLNATLRHDPVHHRWPFSVLALEPRPCLEVTDRAEVDVHHHDAVG
jgi:hypothetical protein